MQALDEENISRENISKHQWSIEGSVYCIWLVYVKNSSIGFNSLFVLVYVCMYDVWN